VKRTLEAYRRWRDGHPERHLWFLVFAGLTVAALVAFPAQDLPVLVEHDLAVIDLALAFLAAGTAGVLAGTARRGQATPRSVLVPTVIGALLALGAVLGYKAIGGIGWPDWWQLALGPLMVAAAGLAGLVAGRVAARLPSVLGPLVTVVVVVAVGFGGAAGVETVKHTTAPTARAERQRCATHQGIRYCANPGYEGLIPYWRRVTEAVLGQVLPAVAAQARLVAQRVDGPQPAGSIVAPTGGWGRGQGAGIAELAFGLNVAQWALGVRRPAQPEDPAGPACSVDGQARAIVQMWLAGQVSPVAGHLAGHLDPNADSITGTTYVSDAIHGGPIAGRYAAQLLARPREQVGQLIRARWQQLTDPRTTYANAERMLGLDHVTPTPTEQQVQAVERERGPACR
jgi:hypothetical protein